MRALTFSLVISLLAGGIGSGADRYPDPDWPQAKSWKEAATSSERIDAHAAWLREHAGLLWTSVVIKNEMADLMKNGKCEAIPEARGLDLTNSDHAGTGQTDGVPRHVVNVGAFPAHLDSDHGPSRRP